MKRILPLVLLFASAALAHPGHTPVREGDVIHAVTHTDHAVPLAAALIVAGAAIGALLKFIRRPIGTRVLGGAVVGLLAALLILVW